LWRVIVDLDQLLTEHRGKLPKVSIDTRGEPEKISPGQFNYLLGLSRDYLPDGHSKSYSQKDVMFDVLREWIQITRMVGVEIQDFRALTKREAAGIINWLLRELGREPKCETHGQGFTSL
jgi:hypothetical protein